ncbi:hypothetical protein [Streptomyces sp. NPDC003247]|uniref:hypothetical protein n=1 Tax=Streptomyces sp. NPDC003247 TaxID=3364677 RepID=UPI0036BB5007
MTEAAGRRRLWRWAVVVWAVTAAVGGGLTLWLQDDAAAPTGPTGWQRAGVPTPLLGSEVTDSPCRPYGSIPPDTTVLCAYAETR